MDKTYCGPPPQPVDLWFAWNFDPPLLAVLLLLAVKLRHETYGLAGVAVLAVAFVSPLCALSSALFSARVIHHVLLVAVAAPLLGSLWSGRAKNNHLGISFTVSTALLWVWHYPAAYDLALSHVGWYWVSQISLLASAVWFWTNALSSRHLPTTKLFSIVAAFAQMGLLGALLTFAPTALYAAHAVAPFSWGLSPLEDQQLAGLIMWVPAGVPYAIAAIFVARDSWNRWKDCPS